MRRSVSLLICLFSFVTGYSQITYKEVSVDYDSVYEYKNLRIIPVRKKGAGGSGFSNTISLNKALEQGLVTVQERGSSSVENVHWLSLYNHSDKNIFVSSGEVLSGGRQDRIVTQDTLIEAGTKRSDLNVMCVEEERWSKKDKKFTYEKIANPHLRRVVDQSRNQVLIWREIHRQLTRDTIKNKTLSYVALGPSKKLLGKTDPYLEYFKEKLGKDSSITGMICISGNKIIGTDIFASTEIFYQQLIPLLKGYIEETLVYGAPVNMHNNQVKAYMDNILENEIAQELFVKQNGKLFKVKNKVVHVTTF